MSALFAAFIAPAKRLALELHQNEPEFTYVAGRRSTLSKLKPLTVVVDTRSSKKQLILWTKARTTGHVFRLTSSNSAAPVTVRVP